MTNEQLYTLLTSYQNRLADELNKMRQQLPETMERHPDMEILGYREEGDFVALDGLKDFLTELNQARESLVPRNVSRPIITRTHYNPSKADQND